jgi:hypothetical protein
VTDRLRFDDVPASVTRSPKPTAEEAQYLADYACELGRLVGNVSSLEMLVRFALYAADTLPAKRLPDGWQAVTLPVNQPLPVNWLTNWCQLSELIGQYNRLERARGSSALIDATIVDLRHAFAHGRILADNTPSSPLILLRFSKPVGETTTIEHRFPLTLDWMRAQIGLVRDAINTVQARIAAQTT